MKPDPAPAPADLRPTRIRYGVLGFACVLSMITYLDRVCFATVAPNIQKEFDLSNSELGLLFTAFAFAYACFEIPSGWLGDVYGPRRTLIRIVLWWSLFTALTGAIYPSAAWPWFAFAAMLLVRFLFGMGEAGAYPNIARSFYNWFPFQERGSAQGAVWMAGRFAGGLSAFVVLALFFHTSPPGGSPPLVGASTVGLAAAPLGPGPLLAACTLYPGRPVDVIHWRHAFWIFGLLGGAWCVIFWWWFRDRPEQHPGVNPAELALIRGPKVLERQPGQSTPTPTPEAKSKAITAPSAGARAGESAAVVTGAARTGLHPGPVPPTLAFGHEPAVGRPAGIGAVPAPAEAPAHPEEAGHAGVPWGSMLTSPNLWSLCLMYFCASYGWYFNITWLPKYLHEQYGVTAESHGMLAMSFLSGAPLLFGAMACLVGGLLTDAFIRRTGNRKWGRRLFGVLGHGVCAACYFMSLAARSPWVFVAAITLATFCNDLTMGSAWASCLDIGRKYSGIVSGCMNTVGNLGGAAAGWTTGRILVYFTHHHWGPLDYLGPHQGWTVNFLSFGAVYVAAMLLWLRFDATRPVVQDV